MQNQTKTTRNHRKGLLKKLSAWVLLVAMTVQILSVNVLASGNTSLGWLGDLFGFESSGSPSGISKFDQDQTISDLKQDFLASIKKELLHKVDDYELSGEVGVILTFTEQSLTESYVTSKLANTLQYSDYRVSSEAKSIVRRLERNQDKILNSLLNEGLISEVRHTYTNLLDGAFVTTTYDQIEALCAVDGINRIMISNTYLPMAAVENPVNVYDTGIFNSGDVSYTGKGTLVAVLDTGCDYTHTAFTSHQVVDPKYNRNDIEALLSDLRANSYNDPLEAREVYYGNITGGKIVYGYDYADKDTDIMPFDNSHGTHVAGIISGKDDYITGVAIDSQLAIMKVFSDYETGAKDGDIIAALEDSIVLGVDAINMSLGTSCGFSFESAQDELYKNDLYGRIEAAGISLVVAASNDYSSGMGGENGSTNKTENPDSATVGAPSTYTSSMSVASINGTKDYYMHANGDHVVFFDNSYDMGAEEYDFFEMLGIKEGEKVSYEYVTVPGLGMAINYAGLDLNGKIALVKRGDISFEEKVQYAQEAGAIAVIIYNNISGHIIMTIGNYAKIPAVSISKDDGDILASKPTGTIVFDRSNVAGPFMSDFSSWGPTPDLKLKPEITAHGGNIISAVIGGYDENSGTSMAAPNMCGITVLIRQYVSDKYPDLTAVEVRDLVNQLCMSTATIALDKNGNPYSPRKQGAGIADIVKSTTTDAYLSVDGINKTKLELGADPERTGVYTMTINLNNLSSTKAASYKLGAIVMTESVSTSDPEYVAEMAHLLSPSTVYTVEGGEISNGIVTVAAGKTAKITAKITLSAEDKSYINSRFENGMFVEGYLTFDNTEEKGVDLNAPFLAFYGDWGEPSIFDLDYYEVETEAHNNAIDEDDKIKADYYATTPMGTYYYDYIIPLGTYLYDVDESEYSPIPATREHAAISYYKDTISGVYGTFTGLLRNAKEMRVVVKNVTTGEVVFDEIEYNCYKAHYSGAPRPYVSKLDLAGADFTTGQALGPNNSEFEVTMTAVLDWEGGKNLSDTYSYSFVIDYEAPTVTDATYRTEYDKGREENRYYLDFWVYDNHYAMSCRPVMVYDLYFDADGMEKRTYSPLSDYPIPVYQEKRGELTKVSFEITDYIDLIANTELSSGISIYVDDYALNSAVYFIPFPETDSEDLEFAENEYEIDINETFDLATLFVHKDTADAVETDYLKTLKWESSDESVVAIHGGVIEGKKQGSAVIKVSSDSWTTKKVVGNDVQITPVYKSIVIKVTDTVIDDNPNSAANAEIEGLRFAYYKTLFAFNNHIDSSAIGTTGSIHFFGGNNSIEFYPSEKIQLTHELKPWNIDEDRYTLIWSSSNPNVATVDDNGVVTAESEGKSRITLQIKFGDKTSLLAARLTVEVKSEFIIENRELVAYKGKGGDVVIPDDEGILYIGSYAFSHFYLYNEKEVEKDENGYYDIDDKKVPQGNNTVTSVVIPEGVETIEKFAFYNCNKLKTVTLPESCENISAYAFANSEVLENINLENVNVVANHAFYKCESLSCDDIGGIDLSNIYTMGDYSFSGTAVNDISLDRLSRVGVGIFSECESLTTVKLGERTRISPKMFEKTPIKSITVYSDIVSDEAFISCEKLTSVVFKNDMTYLGESAFKDCKKLSEVTFEGVVEHINSFAFNGCSALKTLTLPDCPVRLGNSVFGSSGINKVIFSENTEIIETGISLFENITNVTADITASKLYKSEGGAIYTKDGTKLVLAVPNIALSGITVPATVKEICDGALSSVSTLISVSFAQGSQLERIGNYAFANCRSIISIALPDHPVEIGDAAFYYATSLSSIDLSKVPSIGNFAFAFTALGSVNLAADGVNIGASAFNGCTSLRTVTIGKDAVIGQGAFGSLNITEVELLGDATIGKEAFALCQYLTEFDFEDVVTRIGDFAFYGCTKLTAINAPKLTEIGNSSFANCINLNTFIAPELIAIGDNTFAPYTEGLNSATSFVDISLPKLEKIGNNAFYGSVLLRSFNAPNLKEIGESTFALCDKMTSIVYSDELTVIPKTAFYACVSLGNLNLSKVETIGEMALCGVIFPETLELPIVKEIGKYAFAEIENRNYLVNISAPELTTIGDQAFAGCIKLKSLSSPKLRYIGLAAFYGSAIKEIEIASDFDAAGLSAFENCLSFEAFYTTVDGEKKYTAELDNAVISDGVLYSKTENGYVLNCYPVAKTDSEYVVIDGTIKIGSASFMDNKNITKVVFPKELRVIGNFAFFRCDSLDTVVFNSYYAPVLEGTMGGDAIEINPDTIMNYPGFDKLYKYDFYYVAEGVIARPYFYSTFIGPVGSNKVTPITAIIPDNCEGYNGLIYNAYFTISEETSGVTAGSYAIAFIDAVNKLPETVDRFDNLLVEAAIVAYNALEGNAGEKIFVNDALYEKFHRIVKEYNVDRVTSLIAHIFDVDASEYSFNLIKNAKLEFLALTDAERAEITNAQVLDQKVAALAAALNTEIDFNLSYADHLPKDEPPADDPVKEPDDQSGSDHTVFIIIGVSVAVVLAAAAVVFFLLRKKNGASKASATNESAAPDATDNNEEN